MIRKLFSFILLGLPIFLNAQEYEKFTNQSSGKVGIKNKQNHSIVVSPQFQNIIDFNYPYIIVADSENRVAVFDFDGNKLIDYKKTSIFFNRYYAKDCEYDTSTLNKLINAPYFNPRGDGNMHAFIIDSHGRCIPHDYFPCPAWTDINEEEPIQEHLMWIQKGEEYRWQNNIDSAVMCCKKAISLAPENPAPYYWGARLFLWNHQEKIKSNNNSAYSEYFDWVEDCLNCADKLENRYWLRLQVLRLKRSFYQDTRPDKVKLKQTKQQIKEYKDKCK